MCLHYTYYAFKGFQAHRSLCRCKTVDKNGCFMEKHSWKFTSRFASRLKENIHSFICLTFAITPCKTMEIRPIAILSTFPVLSKFACHSVHFDRSRYVARMWIDACCSLLLLFTIYVVGIISIRRVFIIIWNKTTCLSDEKKMNLHFVPFKLGPIRCDAHVPIFSVRLRMMAH